MADLDVRTEALVRALREKGVKVTIAGDLPPRSVTIEQDGQPPEVQLWTDEVSSRTLNRMCRRYGVDRQRVFDIDRQLDLVRGLMPAASPAPASVSKIRPSGSDS